jgi:hypothetical protein
MSMVAALKASIPSSGSSMQTAQVEKGDCRIEGVGSQANPAIRNHQAAHCSQSLRVVSAGKRRTRERATSSVVSSPSSNRVTSASCAVCYRRLTKRSVAETLLPLQPPICGRERVLSSPQGLQHPPQHCLASSASERVPKRPSWLALAAAVVELACVP